jgi:phytoene synthase
MEALYAFTRYTDDLADGPQPVNDRAESLSRWRASFDAALAGRPVPHAADDSRCRLLLPAIVDTIEAFRIPAHYLYAVLDGAEMDLRVERYETFDELADYCHRVASAVGLACLHIWGFRDEEAIDRGRACGLAFQLTNILRDLAEDARRGRCYLPQEDFRRFEYSVDDLLGGRADERFHRLMEFEIERTRGLYRQAATLIQYLERDGQRVFGMMLEVYFSLLQRIASRPDEVLVHQIHLGRLHKLRIAARWFLLPSSGRLLP